MPANKIEEMEEKLNKVLYYLHNDNNTGKKGLVQEMEDMKYALTEVKNEIANFKTRISTVAILASGAVTLAGWIVKLVFFK